MSRDGGEDGWTSDYDSTWEEEDGRKEERAQERKTQNRQNYSRRWRIRAARDLQSYRHGYGGEHSSDQSCMEDRSEAMPNLEFYQNKSCFEPNGLHIEDLLSEWKDDYTTLERNHSYIQWLFPLREFGMNSYAKPLTLNEIKIMKEDKAVMTRFLKAYKLMLQFYGIKLLDEETGEVELAVNWEERFKNLNYHSHNNLRITRILKCLGEMGYDHFQAPLVRFFLEETLQKGQLPNVKRSVLDYFMFAVKDKLERRKLVHFAWEQYKTNNHQDRFIWGPIEKLKRFHSWKENDVNVGSEGLRDDVEKNPDQGQHISNVHESGRASDDEVTSGQCVFKMEKDPAGEYIPMKDTGALPENSAEYNTEASLDQNILLIKDSNSIIGLEDVQIKNDRKEKENDRKKEENVDCENDKEDLSEKNLTKKVHEEDVIKKTEHELGDGLKANGLSSCFQNIENKHNQGDHQRKRKIPVRSTQSPLADGCAAGDETQSSYNPGPCKAEDEGGQVEGMGEKVKKLRLNPGYPNGMQEDNGPDNTIPGENGDDPALPHIGCTLKPHSEMLYTGE